MAKLAMVKPCNGASSSTVALVDAPSTVEGNVHCKKCINAHESEFAPPYLQMPQAHLQLAAEVRSIQPGKHKTQPRCGRSLISKVKKASLRIR